MQSRPRQRRPEDPARQPPVEQPEQPATAEFYRHPGFLLRRAHQIAAASLLRECAGEITPPQFSALQLVAAVPGIDMMGVSRVIGLDRTTGALVINNLVKSGLVERKPDANDRRRYHLRITGAGLATVQRLQPRAEQSEAQLMAVFSRAEQQQFVALLERFVRHFNEHSPAPVDETAVPRTRQRLDRAGAK